MSAYGAAPGPVDVSTPEPASPRDPIRVRGQVDAACGARLRDGALLMLARGQVSAEVHACQVELISGICLSVEEAIADLRALRDAVLGVGVEVVGTGTHPTAQEGEAEITDKERYNFISALLGDAIV